MQSIQLAYSNLRLRGGQTEQSEWQRLRFKNKDSIIFFKKRETIKSRKKDRAFE